MIREWIRRHPFALLLAKGIRKVPLATQSLLAKTVSKLPIRAYNKARLLRSGDVNELVRISPESITRLVRRGLNAPQFGDRFLIDLPGVDYSLLDDLGSTTTARTVSQVFHEGVHYTQTEQYKQMRQAVEQHLQGATANPSSIGAYWCRSLEDIEEYFSILIQAHEDISQHGYRTQVELARIRPQHSRHLGDEVQVSITSRGEAVLRTGGTHRTLIAQQLGLDEIPVRVLSVDRSWARSYLRRRDGSIADQVQGAIEDSGT